jgi:hypothetical protein
MGSLETDKMGRSARRLILSGMKQAKLFSLARRHTRRGLRVLCYHTIAQADEHIYNPVVFMTAQTFRRRMEILRELGVPVVALDDALSGNYPDNATVITFDDGWSSTILAAQILSEFQFPSTLYVTTYYVQKQTQIFNMLVKYVLWKTKESAIDLPKWGIRGEVKDPNLY